MEWKIKIILMTPWRVFKEMTISVDGSTVRCTLKMSNNKHIGWIETHLKHINYMKIFDMKFKIKSDIKWTRSE